MPLRDCLLLLTLPRGIRINDMFELFDSDDDDEDNIARLIEVEMLEEVWELRLYDCIKWLILCFKESTRDVGERDAGEGPS